jgi:hypothetical protein
MEAVVVGSGEALGLDLDPHGPRGHRAPAPYLFTVLLASVGRLGDGHGHGGLLLPPEVGNELWWISGSHVLQNNR